MQRDAPSPGARRHASAVLGTAVLALAAVNLGLRLDREMVDVWDESLYATTALEMVRSGDWLVTTFLGQPDYYNSKPPLNVWLIALLFRAFGAGLWTLRAWSVAAAFATVAAVHVWTRRLADEATANLAALVLATTYAFLYVHAGRTGNADALLALVVTMTAFVTWLAHDTPRRAAWIGPLAAVAFMLKGPGALAFVLPIAMADAAWRLRWSWAERAWVRALGTGLALAAVPVAGWALARWRVDGPALFEHMLFYDIGQRAAAPIEGHAEPVWFYVLVITRHWYDWLTALALMCGLAPRTLPTLWRRWCARPSHEHWIAGGWVVATVVIPTVVPTKLAWYLNPFYPAAALLGALIVREAWTSLRDGGTPARAWIVAGLVVLAVGTAEGRFWYRSRRLDVDRSAQGLLLAQRDAIAGHRVFAAFCPFPETFLASAAGSACTAVRDLEAFAAASAPGDFWLDRRDAAPVGLTPVAVNLGASLHRRP